MARGPVGGAFRNEGRSSLGGGRQLWAPPRDVWKLRGHDGGHLPRFGGLWRRAKPMQIQHMGGGEIRGRGLAGHGHAAC